NLLRVPIDDLSHLDERRVSLADLLHSDWSSSEDIDDERVDGSPAPLRCRGATGRTNLSSMAKLSLSNPEIASS
ncbi:hypothetical protein PENTCL1PPCAC_6765, partial [Pristionchus entomophagus]